MKLPRLITRRRVKWVGLAACTLLYCGGIGSFWSAFGYKTSAVAYNLRGGCFEISGYSVGLTQEWFAVWQPYERYWLPELTLRKLGVRSVHLLVPLWIPLLLIALPTVYLWRTDRRTKPWQCPKCRYDLRGLDGGVCPECGTLIAEPTK